MSIRTFGKFSLEFNKSLKEIFKKKKQKSAKEV
jgi:hypothetical protein